MQYFGIAWENSTFKTLSQAMEPSSTTRGNLRNINNQCLGSGSVGSALFCIYWIRICTILYLLDPDPHYFVFTGSGSATFCINWIRICIQEQNINQKLPKNSYSQNFNLQSALLIKEKL